MMDRPLRAEDLGFADPAGEPLDVLDLPQIHNRPSAKTILDTLSLLSLESRSWEVTPSQSPGGGTPRARSGASTPARPPKRKVRAEGIPQYLTKIVSSHLAWIPAEEDKEKIWDTASVRLSERSGRTAMGSFTRSFDVPSLSSADGSKDDAFGDPIDATLKIQIHEPALTADNLGFKTWAASYVLACTWGYLLDKVTTLRRCLGPDAELMLELGAGTGLVGIAAGAVLGARVLLTDLPFIVPNLQKNVLDNTTLITAAHGVASVASLDWNEPGAVCAVESPAQNHGLSEGSSFKALVIVAADPVYSLAAPTLLVKAIQHHLSADEEATVIIAVPLRESYADVREELRLRLKGIGLQLTLEERAVGTDDWTEGKGDEAREVDCSITVWTRARSSEQCIALA